MLTPSVNVVQSSFGDSLQGEISGLSRSVSNLGSSFGTAIAGTILVAGITATPERSYGLAIAALAVVGARRARSGPVPPAHGGGHRVPRIAGDRPRRRRRAGG